MDKKFFLTMAFSSLTVMAINYFWFDRSAQQPVAAGVQPGQAFKAPAEAVELKPLNRTLEFQEHKGHHAVTEELTHVDTPLCKYVFSNKGGVLAEVEFKKYHGKNNANLRSLVHREFFKAEEGCFGVLFDQPAPLAYTPGEVRESDEAVEFSYVGQMKDWSILKTFKIFKSVYKVDLTLELVPARESVAPVTPRLIFAGPLINEVNDDSSTSFVVTPNGKSLTKVSAKEEETNGWKMPQYIGAEDKYFAHGLVKDEQHFVQRAYFTRQTPATAALTILEGAPVSEKQTTTVSFYIGPKMLDDLDAVDATLEDLLSFGWLSWICKLLLRLLDALFGYLQNYGWAIIVLTILLKIPFLPLSIGAKRKMEEYQRYQPTINSIRARYRSDLTKQHEEIMRFHKEHNISPTTQMIGCLPLLIQMPILFALYRVLGNYVALYQAPFVGWIVDLSAKDPYYVLPILMGATMFWQQKSAPVTDEKQRFMMMFMTLFMTVLFTNFPAGLVLYWFVNNLATMGEDLIRKRFFA